MAQKREERVGKGFIFNGWIVVKCEKCEGKTIDMIDSNAKYDEYQCRNCKHTARYTNDESDIEVF